jgi:membrane protease YdiL (CAAX protease family)
MFAARRSLLFVFLAMLSLVLVQYVWLFLFPDLTASVRLIGAKISECLLAIALVGTLSWWREAGFSPHPGWRDFIPALPPLFLPLLMVIFQFNNLQVSSIPQLLVFAALAAMTGFAEETVFRGISIHALQPRGNMRAALITSLFFGLVHLVNLLQGANLAATIGQVIFAFLIGLAFAAPLIYSGTIKVVPCAYFGIAAPIDFLASFLTLTALTPATAIGRCDQRTGHGPMAVT